MRQKLPISLIAIVRNAGGRVKKLIDNHRDIVSEVIIVDQGSTDGTYEEAVAGADRVFKRRCKGTSDPDRNWAFNLAKQPYVLYLDDDECLTDEAKDALPELIKTGADVFWFKRQNFVDGIDIQEICGDDLQCRFFKKGAVRFPDQIHRYPEMASNTKVFFLECAIRHDRSMEQMEKANRSRERIAGEKEIKLQNEFISKVKSFMTTGLRPSR